jgi:PRC-barrel domain
MKASDLLGATAYDRGGQRLGTINELICRPDSDGRPMIVEVQLSPGRRHRLLGYERPGIQGPWLLEKLANWLHRGTTTVRWEDLNLFPPAERK